VSVKERLKQNWDYLTDFEHTRKRPFFEKAGIVLAVLVIDLLYVILMIQFLQWLLGYDIFAKWAFWGWANGSNVMKQLQVSITVSAMSLAVSILFAVIIAPLWEETVFRLLPLRFGLRYRDKEQELHPGITEKIGKFPVWLLILVVCFIIFGLAHGGPLNLFIQGVGGLFLAYVYLRNGRSFWSAVALHALYNGVIVAAVYTGTVKSLIAAITMPYWIVLFQ